MIKPTRALQKIGALSKRIWVIRGGQGAGKTFAILIIICAFAAKHQNKEILIVSEELTKMRLTVIKDFKKVMKGFGIYEERRFLADTLYKFPNGTFIKFIGLDKEDIGKGLRSDVAYFNEVNKTSQEAYRQISSRAKRVIADYNPDKEFFIDKDVIPREDCDFLQLTFRDNELLSSEERFEIERYLEQGFIDPTIKDQEKLFKDQNIKNAYWANMWRVYGLGHIGNLEGAVYPAWKEIKSLPTEARLLGYGIDFGYTNPAAGVAIYKWNDKIIFDEIFYQVGLSNKELADRLKAYGIKKYHVGHADRAEPKSIKELNLYGLTVKPVKIGGDSISYGIKLVNELDFYYTSDSINLIKEARSYVWDKKAGGDKPVKENDHGMDAKRYGALGCLDHKKHFRMKAA